MIHEVNVTLLLTEQQFRDAESLSQLVNKSKDQLATEGLVELVFTLYDNPERLSMMIEQGRRIKRTSGARS